MLEHLFPFHQVISVALYYIWRLKYWKPRKGSARTHVKSTRSWGSYLSAITVTWQSSVPKFCILGELMGMVDLSELRCSRFTSWFISSSSMATYWSHRTNKMEGVTWRRKITFDYTLQRYDQLSNTRMNDTMHKRWRKVIGRFKCRQHMDENGPR